MADDSDIRRYTIFGERCSGTTFLNSLMAANFDVKLTWEFGFKHFFGFNALENSDDTLFIGIIRHPHTWLNSFYKNPWHVAKELRGNP
jgi:hypothetical protein